MKHHLLLILLLMVATVNPLMAQKRKSSEPSRTSGLSLTVDAGLLIPNDKQANFYSGRPETPNRLDRVLHSEMYGQDIWSRLVDNGDINPSAIPNYRALTVEEYANMYYRLTYQLGVGIRYDYDNGWGWLLGFDYSQVTAAGQFNLSSNNGTGMLGSNQYVTCDIYGIEKRIFIDFAIAKRIALTNILDLELNVGFDLNNTKVIANAMRIAGHNYSILDIWGGQSPASNAGTYDYINQGGIGIGGFGTAAVCYKMHGYSIDMGYRLSYYQTRFIDYNDNDCYAMQHNIFFRFNINNFSFLSK